MMAGADLRKMLLEVGSRYSFTRAELLGLSLTELEFWHQGHRQMRDEEAAWFRGK